MANTRYPFEPYGAHFPSVDYPQLMNSGSPGGNRPILAYDASAKETAYWTGTAWQGLSGTLTLNLTGYMASATSGSVVFSAAVEAVTQSDATNLSTGTSFDTANLSIATLVPGTAGYPFAMVVTLNNNDSIAAGDYFRLALAREASSTSDTATGDCYILLGELRDG